MKCKCKDKCKYKLRLTQDLENKDLVKINIGWFSWRIVSKKELLDALSEQQDKSKLGYGRSYGYPKSEESEVEK